MSRVLAVLIGVLALASVSVWLTTSRPTRSEPAVASATEQEERASSPDLEPPATNAEPAVSAPDLALPDASHDAAAFTREAALTARDEELARAQWIDGRVLFPAGTPADEEVFVTADGRNFADGSDHRARVEPDGSFRVAFSEKTRTGRFELEARYVYLDEVARWRRTDSHSTVVLEPLLGARIEGRVRAPSQAEGRTTGGKVVLRGASDAERYLSHDLTFAFDALAPATEPGCVLSYDGDLLVGTSEWFVLEAGKTLPVALVLHPGVMLSGVVRDESGAPVSGAHLTAFPVAGSGWSSAKYRQAESAADGSFRFAAVEPGEVKLSAELGGFRLLERELGGLAHGTVLADLVLVLQRGQSIAGTVRWPDGTPAVARIEVEWINGVASGESDALGAFSISGLSQRSYDVRAQTTRFEEITIAGVITGHERTRKERTHWSAGVEGVSAGTKDLVLTLTTGLSLGGRVVDDRGAPVSSFRISAERPSHSNSFVSDRDLNKSYRDSNGSFRLDGFSPGEWEVRARSRDHADSEPLRVTLPTSEIVPLILPREAIVSGCVVDPSGAPVPKAEVRHQAVDAQGSFRIDGLGAGTVQLVAKGSGFAPSEALSVELSAGDSVAGLVLQLRRGGTIQGEVCDSDGRPQSEQEIQISSGDAITGIVETDADGRFRVDDLQPGEHEVMTETRDGLWLSERVTVVAGEIARVRLVPPGDVVRLHGRVLAGGAPLAGASLHARRIDDREESVGTSGTTEADEDGAYELILPGPGAYQLYVYGNGGLSWRRTIDVPAVRDMALDVSIPVGRISGRVTNSEGTPLPGILVVSEPERHEGDAHGSSLTSTDVEGRYELRLSEGRHAVRAGGPRWANESGEPYAEARVGGLVVSESSHLRGVDLRLEPGGILTGTVKGSDGSSVPFARLWSWDEGQVRALGDCDENGRFLLHGVAVETRLVGATGNGSATREPVRVEVTAGKTETVALELVPAVRVHFTVKQNGVPVGSDLTVHDAHGRIQLVESRANGEAWLGPVIPGRYTVVARRDVATVERVIEVATSEEPLEIELVFE